MQQFSYVVYVDEEIASSTHEAINQERVNLSKPVTYFRSRKVDRTLHERGMSTHPGVEKRLTSLR